MRENGKLEAASKAPAGAKRILLGITKASLSTDSFISAASRLQPANGLPR
jgi:DNA-directed RNA polymerase subunit beta'